ncbi:spore germination protein [Bacillus sp. ISL-18]|uniref:spore germination protein n=1 Tax=Bacillaceae TaxID=186817 RepID=UPI001BEB1B4D|nr:MULTISPECIES: spore germination protein [Bacillaceae]MBT2658093.1 spore germination protein [Bacillus sp. ISL-18]ULT54586.1 spore germination protein [Neobacillus drentensis]
MTAVNRDGITIGTISGGIVNFGGAVTIAPISITRTTSGSGGDNAGESITTSSGASGISETSLSGVLDIIRRSLA